MLQRKLALLLSLAAGAVLLAACDNTPTGPGGRIPKTSAVLTVQLTDAPGDLAQAWVKIQKIVLSKAVGEPDTLADSATVVTIVPASDEWVNLLALTGGVADSVATDTVPAGSFRRVQLYVCEMYIVTKSGEVIATPDAVLPDSVEASTAERLKLTSQCHSGFKVNMPGDSLGLTAGAAQTLMLDFDAGRSFVHQAGKSGQWIVTPVLQGALKAQASAIKGTVVVDTTVHLPVLCGGDSLTLPKLLGKFVPTASKADTVRSGTTTATGTYQISNVLPGTWTMGVDKVGFANGDTLSFTAVANPATVNILAGTSATSNYAVSAAACKVKV